LPLGHAVARTRQYTVGQSTARTHQQEGAEMAINENHTPKVQRALAKAREVRSRLAVVPPKLDALISIMHADMIDRTAGLTAATEHTPAVKIAERVRA
jgi:hypothetical protein